MAIGDGVSPNIFTGGGSTGMEGLTPLILGAALFGGRGGLFGNNNDAAAGAVTAATVNQAAHDAASMVIATQNQAQAIQDINRVAVDVKDTQAALQHDIAAGAASINNNVLQGQIAAMQGQANIINSVDSHANDISNELGRMAGTLTGQFAAVNAAIAATGAASALASKDAVIEGLRNTQIITANTDANTSKVLQSISDLKESLPSARELNLQREVGVLQATLMEEKLGNVTKSGNVEVTNNINQNTTMNNLQTQIGQLVNVVGQLANHQTAMASNLNILGVQRGINQTPVNVGN